MNEKLLKALQALEPELRKLGPDSANINVNISVDQNGVMYSVDVSDNTGALDRYAKRIPRSK